MRLITLLLCLALPAAAQEKTYDLRLDAQQKPGQKSRLVETSHMKMRVHVGGELAAEEAEETHFDAIELVVAADGKGNAELQHSYVKAQRLVDGAMQPYGFQGRVVNVKRVKGQPDAFTFSDGSRLSEEDLGGLAEAFFTEDGEDDDAAKAFAPSKPVKAGESWNPDVLELTKMFDEDMARAVDVSRSKARFTLKSVEKRGDKEFGKIDGAIELALRSVGPLVFDTPIAMTMMMDIDACIDGSSDDGTAKLKMRMKGSSMSDVEGTKVKIDLDMSMDGEMSQTTVP